VERVVLTGLVALRWAAFAWMALVLALTNDEMLRPWLAVGLVLAALAYSTAATAWIQVRSDRLLRPASVAVELTIGIALVLCDGWVYDSGHAFSTSQSIGSVWPLVAVLSVGVALGRWWATGAGLVLGAAKVGASLANGVREYDGARLMSLSSTAVFYVVAGVVAAYVMELLQRAEHEIAESRARDRIARTLHDGVLQTLAVVERRSTDEDLVRLAREQDRALRRFLFDAEPAPGAVGDIGTALRDVADRFEDRFGIVTQVLLPFDLPPLDATRAEALAGAVNEALTNAGKHADAGRLTVFAEPEGDGVFCSVKDDGRGFDVDATPAGIGLSSSIHERMREAGGRSEVRSRPSEGTEVLLWV
jgi:signal transduction histidine kinase